MHYLQRSSLVPGRRLHVDEVALSNGTITVTILGESRSVAVGLTTADLIMVREES
jgi:Fe2+ transport system protein FeoA